MNEVTTTDLGRFGYKEIEILKDILIQWCENGLPRDFEYNNVTPMMNFNSGNVFLTNEEYQVAMLHNGKLELFYSLSYSGSEGFADELKDMYLNGDITNEEDIEYLYDLNIIDDDDKTKMNDNDVELTEEEIEEAKAVYKSNNLYERDLV